MLMMHEDLKERDKEKKLPEGCRCEDSRYANASPFVVVLLSYKEASRGQTTRQVKKKEESHGCIKSAKNHQLKEEAYELKEEKTISQGQVKKKARNGRAQKIQGQRHTMVRLSETSTH
jgi:hypothetical protein